MSAIEFVDGRYFAIAWFLPDGQERRRVEFFSDDADANIRKLLAEPFAELVGAVGVA